MPPKENLQSSSDIDRFRDAINEQYEEDIRLHASQIFSGINPTSAYLMSRMAEAAHKEALDAADMLATIHFEDPVQRTELIDVFIASFDREDYRGFFFQTQEDLNNNLSAEESREYERLLCAEISALKKVGIVIPKIIKDRGWNSNVFLSTEEARDILEEQRELFEIVDLERRFEEQYGLSIVYDDLVFLKNSPWKESAELPELRAVRMALVYVSELLKKYPPFMISGSGLRHIYFTKNYKDERGKWGGAASYSGDIIIDITRSTGVTWAFDHEFFHRLDQSDNIFVDNTRWAVLNPEGSDVYQSMTGVEVGQRESWSLPPPQGFTMRYGMENPDEDQATIADHLMRPRGDDIHHFLNNCKTDRVLRNKLEMVTGCEFDIQRGRFSRMIPEEEYKTRFGVQGYEYYAKWSKRPEDGRIVMDHHYWNALIDGWDISFQRSPGDGRWLVQYKPRT